MPDKAAMIFKVGDIVQADGWTGRVTQIYKDCCKFDGFELLLLKDESCGGELVGELIEIDLCDALEYNVISGR